MLVQDFEVGEGSGDIHVHAVGVFCAAQFQIKSTHTDVYFKILYKYIQIEEDVGIAGWLQKEEDFLPELARQLNQFTSSEEPVD